jgi:hypothetical protein
VGFHDSPLKGTGLPIAERIMAREATFVVWNVAKAVTAVHANRNVKDSQAFRQADRVTSTVSVFIFAVDISSIRESDLFGECRDEMMLRNRTPRCQRGHRRQTSCIFCRLSHQPVGLKNQAFTSRLPLTNYQCNRINANEPKCPRCVEKGLDCSPEQTADQSRDFLADLMRTARQTRPDYGPSHGQLFLGGPDTLQGPGYGQPGQVNPFDLMEYTDGITEDLAAQTNPNDVMPNGPPEQAVVAQAGAHPA